MIQEPVEKGVKGTNGCLASFIRREQGEHMNTPPLLCHFPKSSTHEDSQSFVGCVNGKKKKKSKHHQQFRRDKQDLHFNFRGCVYVEGSEGGRWRGARVQSVRRVVSLSPLTGVSGR